MNQFYPPDQQGQQQQQQPQQHYQQTNVVIMGQQKSMGLAIILAIILGPVGLLYSSVVGGIVMFILAIPAFIVLFFFGFIVINPICAIWAAIAFSLENSKMNNQAAAYAQPQPMYQPPPMNSAYSTPPPPPMYSSPPPPPPVQEYAYKNLPAPPVAGVTLWCPDCRLDYENNDRFCGGCGKSTVPKTQMAQPPQTNMYCMHCGASVPLDARFCNNCGQECSVITL